MKNLILASKSPRRINLLNALGVNFKIYPSNYIEVLPLKDLKPPNIAKNMAYNKLKSVKNKFKNSIIMAFDTIVVVGSDNKIFGKAKNKKQAIYQLTELSRQKTHKVITAIAIADTNSGKEIIDYEETKVYFRDLNNQEINSYIKKGESVGFAGSYAVQGHGSLLVSKIEGDYFNVVGLPVFKLFQHLKDFGYSIW